MMRRALASALLVSAPLLAQQSAAEPASAVEPGDRFAYSSFGWNLISAVLQEAAGTEFLELMETRVFRPLDMPHTIADHYAQLIPDRTSFYPFRGRDRDRSPGSQGDRRPAV